MWAYDKSCCKFVYFMLINTSSFSGLRINKRDSFSDGRVKLVLIKMLGFVRFDEKS